MDFDSLLAYTGFEWDAGNSDKNWEKHHVSRLECEQIFFNQPLLKNLRPSTKTISVRLPESMLDDLKLLANQRDVPYQSLLKIFLAERIKQELGL